MLLEEVGFLFTYSVCSTMLCFSIEESRFARATENILSLCSGNSLYFGAVGLWFDHLGSHKIIFCFVVLFQTRKTSFLSNSKNVS